MTASLLRSRGRDDSGKVGMIELFFDLVFVFAVTQLSHTLLEDLTFGGLLEVALLMMAVWWVWIFTSWVTNWLDPERIPVRLALFVLMLAGLLLSMSIPQAFGGRGPAFAGAYVFMQVGRTLFFLWAVRHEPRGMTRNFQRILAWLAVSGVFWLAGATAGSEARLAWWALALAIELAGPSLYFWVPGLGRSSTADWNVEGSHMAERCALFVIIALGESLLVTGATFAKLAWDAGAFTGFLAAVLGSILMWWIYFDTGAERAHHRISHSSDPGRQARIAYTYLHTLIVAGIILAAVGDEVALVHPEHASAGGLAALLGAPACFLVGTALFKWVTNDRPTPPLSHVVGLALLAALAWPTVQHLLSPRVLEVATTLVLAVVAVWESLALRRTTAAGASSEHGEH
ncbi:low temperature requirement protein A [Frateuria defendens]|uniref:low temperature requirement protein A n=1 Tax=Frateuria defendens TaxID=2219559 RepID=UPI000AC0CE24|nr:low temperature requirement protein A [Frateuria defendens]